MFFTSVAWYDHSDFSYYGGYPMKTRHLIALAVLCSCLEIVLSLSPVPARAESYVAGAVGVNFADRINSIAGTGPSAGVPGPLQDFDLQNSIAFGGKVGYFPGHSWYGIEGEVLHTTPHIKSFNDDPRTTNIDPEAGIHFRLTTVGINFIARYPGRTVQPYIGAGVGVGIAHIGKTSTVQSDTDVSPVWNILVGLRTFVTPTIALFGEYKYTGATFHFTDAFGDLGGFSGNYRAQYILGGLSYHF